MVDFDFASVRLTDPESALPVKRLLTNVPVRKPNKQEYFRVRAGEEYSFMTQALHWEEDRMFYILGQELWPDYSDHLKAITLRLAVNRQGIIFFIPCPLPSPDGRQNTWHNSLRDALLRAETAWLQMRANMALGAYDLSQALGNLPEPTWPEMPLHELLKIAFRDRIISDPGHPVLKALRGE